MINNKSFCFQKVYYEAIHESPKGNSVQSSMVRSCSANCQERNDFNRNCSETRRAYLGCVKKDCCADADLCNRASTRRSSLIFVNAIMLYFLHNILQS